MLCRVALVYAMILLGLDPGGALRVGSLVGFVALRLMVIGAGALCTPTGIRTFAAHRSCNADRR